jgi:rhodanese-related sulfurtransferase
MTRNNPPETHFCTTMKRILTILTSICALVGCKADGFESVDAERFAQIIQDTTVVRLDVRTTAEYQQGHIPGAILIDVTQGNFLEEAKHKLPKEQTIALYCRSGRRSKKAANLLVEEGYKVVELNAGFNSWNGEVE